MSRVARLDPRRVSTASLSFRTPATASGTAMTAIAQRARTFQIMHSWYPSTHPGMHSVARYAREVAYGAAFPAAVRPEVAAAVSIMPSSPLKPAAPFAARVDGQTVSIPYRIYNAEPAPLEVQRLSPTQQTVLACLYTRHHNGYVRQRHTEAVVRHALSWVCPFVVQLLGEYVVQIVLAVRSEMVDLDQPGTAIHTVYGDFAAANREFIAVTWQRATSYWNCYYRGQYADRRTYPSFPILASLLTTAVQDQGAAG